MSIVGIVLAGLGFLYALIVFPNKLIYGNPIQSWTPLMIVVLVLGGFQSLILGIIGEYMANYGAGAKSGYVCDGPCI